MINIRVQSSVLHCYPARLISKGIYLSKQKSRAATFQAIFKVLYPFTKRVRGRANYVH